MKKEKTINTTKSFYLVYPTKQKETNFLYVSSYKTREEADKYMNSDSTIVRVDLPYEKILPEKEIKVDVNEVL